jgi:hypothetical protein
MRSLSCLLVLALMGSLSACTCEAPTRRRDTGGLQNDAGSAGESGAACRDGLDNDADGLADCDDPECRSACSDAGPGMDFGFAECVGSDYVAETRSAPVDIIFVIDNSGSMDEEAAQVQMRLNGFVEAIGGAGIDDYHVIMLTQLGFVSVPDPLGSDASRYRFVDTNVQSTDSFERLLEQLPVFTDFLRPTAVTHVVFVTDDESRMSAAAFQGSFESALGHPFRGHAIASPPDSIHTECPFPGFCLPPLPGCSGPGGAAADNGRQYWELASATGGTQLSICAADWAALFTELLMVVAVPTTIPCNFLIPEPPEGTSFDPNLANVVFTPLGGEPMTIPRAASGDCTGAGVRWIYNDPDRPTEILLCNPACDLVEASADGAVRIQLGCETLIL